jgi:ubiquitin carboxyl-terminal hydrolase 36/42
MGSGSVDSQDAEAARIMSRKEYRRQRREEKKLHEKSDWLKRELTQITREYAQPDAEPSSSWFYANQQPIVDPGSITREPDRLSKCLRPYQQEDAHEFLRALLSTLTMNGHNKQLSSLFDGLLESAVTCQVCHHASLTRDRYMDLSLDIVANYVNTLDDALREFTKTELLDFDNKVMCAPCGKKQPVAKGLRLATAPSILVCHLKRFAFDVFGRMVRLNKHVHFPLRLEIGDYMSRVNKAKPPPYELVGVLVHQGRSCDSGHYLAYVKCQNEWYKANDSVVSKVDMETVMSQQAYILLYEVAGMRSNTIQRYPRKPVKNSWKDEDLPQAPMYQGSQAPEPDSLHSSLLNILCNVSEANEAIFRDFCCGAGNILCNPSTADSSRTRDSRTEATSSAHYYSDMPSRPHTHYEFNAECDATVGDNTIGDGSTVYTTDSSQLSGLRRSTSGGDLREFENEASRAYENHRRRSHSFADSDPGAKPKPRSQSAHKPRTRKTSPPSHFPPPRPNHHRRHHSSVGGDQEKQFV